MLIELPIVEDLCCPRRPRMGQKARDSYRRYLRSIDPRCYYCGRVVSLRGSTLDHVTPRSRGGTDSPGNLVLCCKGCNTVKADRPLAEWLDVLEEITARVRFTLIEMAGPTG